jgi:hypothetical protein
MSWEMFDHIIEIITSVKEPWVKPHNDDCPFTNKCDMGSILIYSKDVKPWLCL